MLRESDNSPVKYKRIAEAFPQAWLEDPGLNDETDEVLRPHRDRITWDAPIHSVADAEALPFPPRCLNVKPSRLIFTILYRCSLGASWI